MKVNVIKTYKLENGDVSGMFKIPADKVTAQARHELIDLEGVDAELSLSTIIQDTTAAPSRLDTLRSMQEYLLTEIAAEMAKGEPIEVLPAIPLDTLPLNMEPERCCDTCVFGVGDDCTLAAETDDALCGNYSHWEAK